MSPRPVFDHEAVREVAGLYALGALDADEAAAVREHLASCALEHPELDEGAVWEAVLDPIAKKVRNLSKKVCAIMFGSRDGC